MPAPNLADRWPQLDLEEWRETKDTLHMWTQIIGKLKVELAPFQNHLWHTGLTLTARGLTTGPLPVAHDVLQADFDFLDHTLILATGRGGRSVIRDDLRPSLVGEDPFDVSRLWQRMAYRSHQRGPNGMLMQAISGVDIALWDLIGQATQTPLYRLFGAYRDRLEAYASAGFYAGNKSCHDLAEEVGGYAERGFRGVKIKVGRNPEVMLNPLPDAWAPDYATVTLEEDIERVRAARTAIGPSVRLAIDANNAWTPPTAIQFMRAVGDQQIAWLEEPVWTEDLAGSAHVADVLDVPVSGYETTTGLAGFRDLISQRAVDIVQPDVIWTGGFTVCRKVAALAEAYRLPVIPHVFSSAVALVANMHLIASLPNANLVEFDQNRNPLRSDLLETPIDLQPDGTVRLPDRPGLGIALNSEVIEQYRVQ